MEGGSEGKLRIQKAWAEALSVLPSCREKRSAAQSDNHSFGGILKRHIVSVEKNVEAQERAADEGDSDDATKVEALLSQWDRVEPRTQLLSLVRLFKTLDPILARCQKKLQSIQSGREAGVGSSNVTLESLIAYGRRISAHVRAPPEYSDPTGHDGLCVPGYFFPCPDYLMMSRSTLFHTDKVRSVPPSITFKPDPRTRAMYWIDIQTPTANASIRFAINSMSSWSLYNPNQKPHLAGPGSYTVRAYCQAEGFYASEVTVASIDIESVESDKKISIVDELDSRALEVSTAGDIVSTTVNPVSIQTPQSSNLNIENQQQPPAIISTQAPSRPPPSVAAPAPAAVKFGGLFLCGSSSSHSSDDEDRGDDDDDEE